MHALSLVPFGRRVAAVALMLVACASASSVSAQQRPANRPSTAAAQQPEVSGNDPRVAPARREGEGPFQKLIIRGAILIDGTGGPPRGPVDIVIENNMI